MEMPCLQEWVPGANSSLNICWDGWMKRKRERDRLNPKTKMKA